MTLLAFAERLRGAITADEISEERHHERVVYTARVGKQTFVVTCEEQAPDRDEPAMT
jgi:hypothetical protein